MSEKGKNLKNRGLEQFLNKFFTYALKYLIPASSLTLTGCMSTFPDRRVEDPTRTSIPDGPTPQTQTVPEGRSTPRPETQQQENRLAEFEINVGDLVNEIIDNPSKSEELVITKYEDKATGSVYTYYSGNIVLPVLGVNGEERKEVQILIHIYEYLNQDVEVGYVSFELTSDIDILMFIAPRGDEKTSAYLGKIVVDRGNGNGNGNGGDSGSDNVRYVHFPLQKSGTHGVFVVGSDDSRVSIHPGGKLARFRVIIGQAGLLQEELKNNSIYTNFQTIEN